jgi:hypothetical protein
VTISTGKGEVVFEVQPGRGYLLAGLGCLLAGPLLYLDAADVFHKGFGAACVLIGLVGLGRGLFQWAKTLKCYRGGFEWEGRFIPYGHIEILRAAILNFQRYNLRVYKLKLQGSDSVGPFAVNVQWSARESQSPNIDYLIRAASAPIAHRMKADIERCGTARWGEHAVFGKDSVTIAPSGHEFLYRDIAAVKLAQGFLSGQLVLRSRDGSRATIKSKADNFYPGYYFLLSQIPPQSKPRQTQADVFEKPVHRIRLIAAIGFLAVALAILSLPLLVPIPDKTMMFVMAGGFLLASAVFLWWSRKQ